MKQTIEHPQFTTEAPVDVMPKAVSVDHDVAAIAIGFGQKLGAQLGGPRRDFGTTTMGEVTFRKVDPLREPFRVADARLQVRLEELCETLRAKY